MPPPLNRLEVFSDERALFMRRGRIVVLRVRFGEPFDDCVAERPPGVLRDPTGHWGDGRDEQIIEQEPSQRGVADVDVDMSPGSIATPRTARAPLP